MPGNILYIGSPLLDLSCTCDPSLLVKYNLKPDDCIQVTNVAIFDEILPNPSLSITPGGSAQNSARVSKWLLEEEGQISFAGCVGRDEYAEKMKQELEIAGVNPLYDYHKSLPTGLCACLVAEKGKRSMCTRLGAASTFGVEFLGSQTVLNKMSEADIIYVVGYFVSHSHAAVMKAAQYSCRNNTIFAINLSATYICKSHTSKLMECMPYVDIVFGNESEALAFVEALGSPMRDIEACAVFIASLPKKEKSMSMSRVCIISQGADAVVVGHGNGDCKIFKVPHVDVTDTIGCGDALVGGILARISRNREFFDDAVRTGIEVATLVAQTSGCTLPSRKLVSVS